MKVVIVTGGFDPIHSGYIAYFNAAKALGDKLVVGLNSDAWLTRKKGRPFMSWYERCKIVMNLKMVDHVIEFNDDDDTAIISSFKSHRFVSFFIHTSQPLRAFTHHRSS